MTVGTRLPPIGVALPHLWDTATGRDWFGVPCHTSRLRWTLVAAPMMGTKVVGVGTDTCATPIIATCLASDWKSLLAHEMRILIRDRDGDGLAPVSGELRRVVAISVHLTVDCRFG